MGGSNSTVNYGREKLRNFSVVENIITAETADKEEYLNLLEIYFC